MSEVKFVKVKDIDDGMRLNRWFLKYYPNLPLSRLQKLIRTKQIKLDGKRCEVSAKLIKGQEIRIPPIEEATEPKDKNKVSPKDEAWIKSMIIYKDENIIVINKPSGLAVQGGSGIKISVDAMLPALKFDKEEAPKLVHRIDKDTSGILVLARDRKNAEALTKAFKFKDLQKTYLAICVKTPKNKEGVIKAPLEKIGEKMKVSAEGKVAVTEYKVLDDLGEKSFALIEAKPLTGRTHQIRAHLEYIGAPIVGDDKYFGEQREKFSNIKDKLYLHAYKIDLTGIYKKLKLTADLPEHFKDAMDEVGLELK